MTPEAINVLLVEDNPGDARLVREALEDSSGDLEYALDHADRLDQGLARIADERFDIVLLDLGLPDTNGLDTLCSMRARARDLPVIVL